MENTILSYKDKISQIIAKLREIDDLEEEIEDAQQSIRSKIEQRRIENKAPFYGTLGTSDIEDWDFEDYIEKLWDELFEDCQFPWMV